MSASLSVVILQPQLWEHKHQVAQWSQTVSLIAFWKFKCCFLAVVEVFYFLKLKNMHFPSSFQMINIYASSEIILMTKLEEV